MGDKQNEPGGFRSRVPPIIRTALAAETWSSRAVVLSLEDSIERSILAEAFHGLGWKIHNINFCVALITLVEPDLIISDDPCIIADISDVYTKGLPDVVILVDGRESAIEGAWNAGADCVLIRPLDPRDPLGLTKL